MIVNEPTTTTQLHGSTAAPPPTADALAEALGARRNGTGWMARCPAHDDADPSLSIHDGDNGAALFKCFGGCTQEAVLAALRAAGAWPDAPPPRLNGHASGRANGYAKRPASPPPRPAQRRDRQDNGRPWWVDARPVQRWAYLDPETGAVVAYHERRERPHPDKPGTVQKAYPWTHPDGRLSRRGELAPATLPLYGIDRLKRHPEAIPVVVEGERAADAYNQAADAEGIADGAVAVSFPGGASQKAFGPALESLAGRPRVAIWPDHDRPGATLAGELVRALGGLDPGPAVVDLPSRMFFLDEPQDGQDAWEWVERDHKTAGEVLALIRDREPVTRPRVRERPDPVEGPQDTPARRYRLTLTRLSTVQALPVTYLPGGHILEDMLTLLVGDPGLGKTRLALSLAAAVTKGDPWPEGADRGTPGNVLWCGQEDTLEHVIRPVFEALGGDPERFYAIDALRDTEKDKESAFTLAPEGVEALDAAMAEVGPRLLIIDPITGHLGRVDSFKDAEVRAALLPLAVLSRKRHCATLGLGHLNKAQQAAVAYRIGGSIAFRAVARAVFFVAPEKDPDGATTGRNVLYQDKANLGAPREPRGYSIIDRDGYGVVAWDRSPVAGPLCDALTPGTRERTSAKVEEAERWLAAFLAGGPRPATEVKEGRNAAGIGDRAIDRAKDSLRVRIDKRGGVGTQAAGYWEWSLPGEGGG